jgi:chromate reductase, NAD(P)H dehydrogenase (quinone)
MTTDVRLLLISGSLRLQSTNTAALRTAVRVAPEGVRAVLFSGLADLPHFNPDEDGERLPAAAAELRAQIHRADALLFSTPEYAGALPGSFKNLLDWTIGDDQPGSIYRKPVGWINVSARGATGAHAELRQVLGYATASIVEEACAAIPVTAAMVDVDGLIHDQAVRDQIAAVLAALAAHACERPPVAEASP